ncbi:hypothetical protein [Cytobacillus firmus]|uniref:hypothetical protein n=1 Tax=Cytobacillus firmus TaxID=1399 RepID=UPI0024950669|nr:hypothetical protein [Cytobacillus firmus]
MIHKPLKSLFDKANNDMEKLNLEFEQMQNANRVNSEQIRNSMKLKSEDFKQKRQIRKKQFDFIRNK